MTRLYHGGIQRTKRGHNRPSPRPRRDNYYFVVSRLEGGQNVVNGPHDAEDDAYQWGYANLDGDFTVRKLPTYDLNRANRIIRNDNVADGQTVKEVLRRTKHKF